MVSVAAGMGRAQRIREVLAGVADPEIPVVSVLDLGIVREIDPDGGAIAITPTYSGCPATAVIAADIRAALADAGLGEVRLTTRLDPPWTTDRMTEEGRTQLRSCGVAA